MVPAVTISPSLNFFRAKSLAAASVSNVWVKRMSPSQQRAIGRHLISDVPSVVHAVSGPQKAPADT